MLTLQATASPTPGGEDDPTERAHLTADGATYEEARAAIEAQVPPGWRLLFVGRDLDSATPR